MKFLHHYTPAFPVYKGSNYMLTVGSMDCVSLPLILEMPNLCGTSSLYYGLKLAKVTLVHMFYTLVTFSLLLAKQTFFYFCTHLCWFCGFWNWILAPTGLCFHSNYRPYLLLLFGRQTTRPFSLLLSLLFLMYFFFNFLFLLFLTHVI